MLVVLSFSSQFPNLCKPFWDGGYELMALLLITQPEPKLRFAAKTRVGKANYIARKLLHQ